MTESHELKYHPMQFTLPAYIAWIEAEGFVPDLTINVIHPNVMVPERILPKKADQLLILNLSTAAISGVDYNVEGVSFSARFGGKSEMVFIPYQAMGGLRMRGSNHYVPLNPVALVARTVEEFGEIVTSADHIARHKDSDKTDNSQDKTTPIESRDGNVIVGNFGRKK